MKKLITISVLALLVAACCQKESNTQQPVKTVETVEDHRSTKRSITFTLHREVNHIGKSSLNKILNEELFKAADRINQRLSKSGLPQGKMDIEKK